MGKEGRIAVQALSTALAFSVLFASCGGAFSKTCTKQSNLAEPGQPALWKGITPVPRLNLQVLGARGSA